MSGLHDKDLVLGGIVIDVREGYTKRGNPYGVAKVEDYSGVAEFAFFGSDWVEKKNFFAEGMFLFMRGKCVPDRRNEEKWEVKINTIELLPEVKDRLVEKITVTAPLLAVTDDMVMELSTIVKKHPGTSDLYFLIRDEDGQMYVNLLSRTVKVSVGKELVGYLKSQPLLDFKIN